MSEIDSKNNTAIMTQPEPAKTAAKTVAPKADPKKAVANKPKEAMLPATVNKDFATAANAKPEVKDLAKVEKPKAEKPKAEKKETSGLLNYFRDKFPLHGAFATAFFHTVAAGVGLTNFESKAREVLDEWSLHFSKGILTINSFLAAGEALVKNRLWESIARFVEPFFFFFVNLEDLGLARGMGLGLSQLDISHEGIVDKLLKKAGKTERTIKDDLTMNSKAFGQIVWDILAGGIFSNRRFLTGFGPGNVVKKLGEAMKTFNLKSFKHLNDKSLGDFAKRFKAFSDASGVTKIKEIFSGDDKIDQGHTTALSGYLMIIGGALGYIGKATRGSLYKIGGTLRNLGGAIADVGLFGHPDSNMNISAIFLAVNTVMDIVQRFLPNMKKVINPFANISMAAYNVGVAIYLHRSRQKTTDNVVIYDADGNKQPESQAPEKATETKAVDTKEAVAEAPDTTEAEKETDKSEVKQKPTAVENADGTMEIKPAVPVKEETKAEVKDADPVLQNAA